MRVPEEDRARREVVVDVLASGDVPHAAALAALHHQVQLGRDDEEAGAASGEILPGVGEETGLLLCAHDQPFLLAVNVNPAFSK